MKYIFYNNNDYRTNFGNLRISGNSDTKQWSHQSSIRVRLSNKSSYDFISTDFQIQLNIVFILKTNISGLVPKSDDSTHPDSLEMTLSRYIMCVTVPWILFSICFSTHRLFFFCPYLPTNEPWILILVWFYSFICLFICLFCKIVYQKLLNSTLEDYLYLQTHSSISNLMCKNRIHQCLKKQLPKRTIISRLDLL